MAKNRYSKIIKIFLVFLAFLILIFLSETIYTLNNNSPLLTSYYINKAQVSARNSDVDRALSYLTKAAKFNIRYQARQYPNLVPSIYNLNFSLPKTNPPLNQAYFDYIQNLDAESLSYSDGEGPGKIFYSLGLLAYKNNQPDLVVPLFQTAIYIDPQLSHYHIELANFYLMQGDDFRTRRELSYCLKFKNAKNHCQQYIDNNLYWNVPEEIGFLEKAVEAHYK